MKVWLLIIEKLLSNGAAATQKVFAFKLRLLAKLNWLKILAAVRLKDTVCANLGRQVANCGYVSSNFTLLFTE